MIYCSYPAADCTDCREADAADKTHPGSTPVNEAEVIADGLVSGFLESFCVLGYLKLVDASLDVSVHKNRKVVHTPVDAMVGHSSLRIIVSTDLGRAVTGADHGLALGRDTVEILLVFKVIESGTEFLEGPVLVFELRAFLLTDWNFSFEGIVDDALTTCCESYSTEGHHSSDRPCQRFLDNVFRSS